MTRCIVFDCMDTLIQMRIPSMEIYSDWAYQGAEPLGLWDCASSFRDDWVAHRDRFVTANSSFRESTVLDRLRDMLRRRAARHSRFMPLEVVEEHAARIHAVYWERYREASYVLPEVTEALDALRNADGLTLAVASNFMVPGGIPELLELHGLASYFDVVVVSCDIGWRKPAEPMYRAVLAATKCAPEDVLFVGDNPLADYDGPRVMGMRALLYDPRDVHAEVGERVRSLAEVPGRV